MMKKTKISVVIIIILLLVGAVFFVLARRKNTVSEIIVSSESGVKNTLTKTAENDLAKEQIPSLPSKIIIDVPFTSQAPFANWDAYHEDACEEAAIIMVKYYLDKKNLSKEDADREIMSLIDFEIKNYGGYIDSDTKQMMDMSKKFYGITNMKAVYDFKKEDIKKYLALGKPIIIPAAGRLLGNPNFKNPGPLYHALVLTGYNGDWIITNDPGTRKGEDYRYKIDVLYKAIHDFPGDKNNIEQGRKAMIVLE